MNRTFISELEELVLLSVGVLNPDAYAYSIRKEINDQINKSLSLASVHTVLYRLEKEGLLKSDLGGKSEKRGGRSKRLFSLTKIGTDTVHDIQNVRHAMWTKMQSI
jgi:DNA-binding PadR family transcriptional regulator